MGEVASGCSCGLFVPNVDSKARNIIKYTTIAKDTESDSDGSASNDDSDDNPQIQKIVKPAADEAKKEKKSKKKIKNKKKYKKDKKKKKDKKDTSIKMINTADILETDGLVLSPGYFEDIKQNVVIPERETFNFIKSKQTAPNLNKLILNFIDESSDIMDMENQTIVYHDHGSFKSLDNLSLNLPLPPDLYHYKSADHHQPLPFIERRCSLSPTTYSYYNSSDSLPSILPQFPSSSKSFTPNTSNTYIPSTSKTVDTLSLQNITSKPKPAKRVLTRENYNDWPIDRMVSEKDAMQRQLLFLKQFERSRKPNTYWIEKNENI